MKHYHDILFPDAVEITLQSRIASIARLQDKLQIGPKRAASLVDEMEHLGIVGPSQSSRPRSILISLDEWYECKHEFIHQQDTPVSPIPPVGESMYCRHCGKQLASSAKFCDSCGKPTTCEEAFNKNKKKHPILTTVIILIFLFLMIGSCGNTDSDEPQNVESNTPSTTDTRSVSKTHGIGDRLEMDDVYVTLNDVYEIPPSQFFEPKDGMVFVICDFTIENERDEEIAVSSMMSFEAYFDDYSVDYSYGAAESEENKDQIGGNIAAGKKMRGVTGFEAPIGWTNLEITFKTNPLFDDPFVFNYSK